MDIYLHLRNRIENFLAKIHIYFHGIKRVILARTPCPDFKSHLFAFIDILKIFYSLFCKVIKTIVLYLHHRTYPQYAEYGL